MKAPFHLIWEILGRRSLRLTNFVHQMHLEGIAYHLEALNVDDLEVWGG